MRTTPVRIVTISLLSIVVLAAGCYWYLHRVALRELGRIERLAESVKSLKVGESSYQDARAIAEQFGATKFKNDWGTYDCNDGYFERCAYQISLRAPTMGRILRRFSWVRRIGLGAWNGTVHIFIKDGKVDEYYFSVLFQSSDRQWRGFGTEEFKELSLGAVSAHISDSYVVSRNDIIISDAPDGMGYSLDSTLTPQATESERERAWHYDFSCLATARGCNEICDVLPDSWKDFYLNRGRFDVQKYGSRYAFCNNSAMPPSPGP
jgi:hypothetical protein